MLQGAAKLDKLIDKALEFEQNSLALTDHGNMFGMLEFYTLARKKKIKPIIGCDMYIANGDRKKTDYNPGEAVYHKLILIARDNKGYKNLMKLSSVGYVEGLHEKPRIDWESLEKHNGGLTCLTGNYQGELGALVLEKNQKRIDETLAFYEKSFGKENVYLCVQDHGLEEEKEVNKYFLKLHETLGYSLVAVNDVHYVERENNTSHDVLLCIEGRYKKDDPDRPRFNSDEYYFKSSAEMQALFSAYPGAIENTVKIADECDVEIDFNS
ncbi:MAG: PHP domain-containing protein, partial [Candidatus Margulisbacteria bacterium]|nr:PHP domain-containing protein [Candidatus Margulisiibacteriota bacterium]